MSSKADLKELQSSLYDAFQHCHETTRIDLKAHKILMGLLGDLYDIQNKLTPKESKIMEDFLDRLMVEDQIVHEEMSNEFNTFTEKLCQ